MLRIICISFLFIPVSQTWAQGIKLKESLRHHDVSSREHISLNKGWRFMRYQGNPDKLVYDERPAVNNQNDAVVADTRATDSTVISTGKGLKKWILPSANDFIKDPAKKHQRPEGDPGKDFLFVQKNFDDNNWQQINLPHDWSSNGPFYEGPNAIVGGGMGRLPVQGVGWYRKKLDIPATDSGRRIYLDIDGAMSYTMVWLNGHLVGGWPYGYNSFRLDLTPYIEPEHDNQLAIRLDNPPNSSRWYPGAGLYRNVWLTKLSPVHVAQWGTFVQTKKVSSISAVVDMTVDIENKSNTNQKIEVVTTIFALNSKFEKAAKPVKSFAKQVLMVNAGESAKAIQSITIGKPLLWGPAPLQKANLYAAVTHLYKNGMEVDEYETHFGIRKIVYDPLKGIIVNNKPIRIQGVNQHHDLGSLGAAFNIRAAKRQLEILKDAGCNAIRMAHNPPATELLDLTDQMGFLVIDEIYDCWEKGKTPLDFHLIFPDWYEADARAFVRRDKNHPSVIAWSFGNEVGEQYTGEEGAKIARELYNVVRDEDSSRPATASMNYAKADMPFPKIVDIICLNYQGEGIRDAPAYANLKGIRTPPLYPSFQKSFPGKLMVSSETSSALSTRGTYLFPVYNGTSAPVADSTGGDSRRQFISSYELYTAPFGASPDKVFATQDKHPFVAGEFVWSGWDYLGEPTPYYTARSSYSGIVDLAGFKKDRYYLYQSRWRPRLPMAHILPHWTWPDRTGMITPVHVFSSGDEAELFLNNQSLGKRKKQPYEYRFRWDSVVYKPGMLTVITYKEGKQWAADTVRTAGNAASLSLAADQNIINNDGDDLSFITLKVLDAKGTIVPEADNKIAFGVSEGGEIVTTDNGDPSSLVSFASHERNAFNGLALVIVRAKASYTGPITISAVSAGLTIGKVIIVSKGKT